MKADPESLVVILLVRIYKKLDHSDPVAISPGRSSACFQHGGNYCSSPGKYEQKDPILNLEHPSKLEEVC